MSKITKELVKLARKSLIGKGEYPSEEKILDFIGSGSAATVHKYNKEILLEERREVLGRAMVPPDDLCESYFLAVTKRSDEISAICLSQVEEMERSLDAAREELDELTDKCSTFEEKAANLEAEKNTLLEASSKGKAAWESEEKALKQNLEDKKVELETVTAERDELANNYRELEIGAARNEETIKHQEAEVKRLTDDLGRMLKDLEKERHKASSAEEKAVHLSELLKQKEVEAGRIDEIGNKLLEQFKSLQESMSTPAATSQKSRSSKSNGGGAKTQNKD